MALRLAQLRQLLHTRFPDHSQAEVARTVGIEPSALSRWLAGGNASFPQVAAVAAALRVPYTLLWNGPVPRRYADAAPADPALTLPPLAVVAERQWAVRELTALATLAREIADRAEGAAARVGGVSPPAAGAPLPGEQAEAAGPAAGPVAQTTPTRPARPARQRSTRGAG